MLFRDCNFKDKDKRIIRNRTREQITDLISKQLFNYHDFVPIKIRWLVQGTINETEYDPISNMFYDITGEEITIQDFARMIIQEIQSNMDEYLREKLK